MVHVFGVASWKVRTTTTIEEERVARNQRSMEEEALASWGVTGCVDEIDGERSDFNFVATVVADNLLPSDSRGAGYPRHLVLVRVDGHIKGGKQRR